jgi:hypothetical protein
VTGQRKAAVQRLKQARAELDEPAAEEIAQYGRGNVPETDEFLRRNRAVVEAEKGVPWYRR